MASFTVITELAHVIELAVAPVFLLAGIAGFLNVMSGRLGRIVDRTRILRSLTSTTNEPDSIKVINAESEILFKRISVINSAIGFCTASGLCICFLIVSLFLASFWSLAISFIITLFIFAMLLLIIALILFLREIQLTTKSLNFIREYSS